MYSSILSPLPAGAFLARRMLRAAQVLGQFGAGLTPREFRALARGQEVSLVGQRQRGQLGAS